MKYCKYFAFLILVLCGCQPQTIFESIFITDKYILGSDMQRLLIFNKFPIRLLSSTKIGDRTYSIVSNANIIYTASEGKGVRIYDITDPTQPRLVSIFKTGGEARKLILKNEKLFVANSSDKVFVLNVSNPQHPELVSEIRLEPYAPSISDIEVEDDIIYVSDWQKGLIIVDVTEPSNARIMGRYPSLNGHNGSSEKFGDLEVRNRIAYIEVRERSSDRTTLRIFDMTNPSQSGLVGSIDMGNRLYRSVLHNTSIFMTHENTIKVFSITEPKSPQLVHTFPVPNAFLIAADHDTVYVAGSLQITKYDFSNPLQPVHMATYDRSQELQ